MESTGKSQALTRSQGFADHLFTFAVYVIAIGALIAIGYPLYNVVINSISDPDAIYQGRVFLWPVKPTIEAYIAVINYPSIWLGYRNSVFYTFAGTLINLVVTIFAAFPLARRDLYGRHALTFIFSFTMFFSGGMIPTYMVVMNMGLLNTIWAMLIPGAISVYSMIITRTFIASSIPDELLEATQIDGCNDFSFFFLFVLPLSKAVIAVIAMRYAVGHWNSFFSAFLYLTRQDLYPLQVFLREILVMNQIAASDIVDPETAIAMQGLSDLLKYSLIVISTAPILCIYPFFQKYFVKGVMIGSIKG